MYNTLQQLSWFQLLSVAKTEQQPTPHTFHSQSSQCSQQIVIHSRWCCLLYRGPTNRWRGRRRYEKLFGPFRRTQPWWANGHWLQQKEKCILCVEQFSLCYIYWPLQGTLWYCYLGTLHSVASPWPWLPVPQFYSSLEPAPAHKGTETARLPRTRETLPRTPPKRWGRDGRIECHVT